MGYDPMAGYPYPMPFTSVPYTSSHLHWQKDQTNSVHPIYDYPTVTRPLHQPDLHNTWPPQQQQDQSQSIAERLPVLHIHDQPSASSSSFAASSSQERQVASQKLILTPGSHAYQRADLGYMEVTRKLPDPHTSDDEEQHSGGSETAAGVQEGDPHQQQHYGADLRDSDTNNDNSNNEREDGSDDEIEGDSDTSEDNIQTIHTSHDVPADQIVFENIHLIKHNPDNHLAFMDCLNKKLLRRKYNRAQHAKKCEDLRQCARALGWMTMGRFGHASWSESLQKQKSPAVHAVYASTKDKDILLYPKKEQNWRKDMIRNEHQIRQLYNPYFNGEEDPLSDYRDDYTSRHEDLHDVVGRLQGFHDELEDEQFSNYYDDYLNGRMPRLKHDPKLGFRLVKSRAQQQLTRLYSQEQLDLVPESESEKRLQMEQENKDKILLGVKKVMDLDTSSSDEEYQLPSRAMANATRAPHHYDVATMSFTPRSNTIPYDSSQRFSARSV